MTMNFRVSKRKVADLQLLLRLVLKSIYEPLMMSLEEEKLLQTSFIDWNRKIKITEEEQYQLERLAWLFDENQKGTFDERKAMFKDKGIDWRKFHRLPEAYRPADFKAGQAALAKWNEENPELSGL